jgi:opacity protein-like surface antigen
MIALPILFILGFVPKTMTFDTSAGLSQSNWHGQSMFRSAQMEIAGRSRLFRASDVGAAAGYSAIRQPSSWWGHTYGDPDVHVHAASLYLFVRRERRHAFVELGSGPLWSTRRVPAACSQFNFETKLGFGLLFAKRIRIGYRFSHISNAGLARHNPGWNVHTVSLGVMVKEFLNHREHREH